MLRIFGCPSDKPAGPGRGVGAGTVAICGAGGPVAGAVAGGRVGIDWVGVEGTAAAGRIAADTGADGVLSRPASDISAPSSPAGREGIPLNAVAGGPRAGGTTGAWGGKTFWSGGSPGLVCAVS